MDVGDKMRKFREELGLSQTQVSEESGIRQTDISRMEKSKMKPRQDYMQYLHKKGCDLNWLLTGENVNPIVNPIVNPNAKSANEVYINYAEEQEALYKRVSVPAVVTVDSTGRNTIPVIDVQAAAGFPAHFQDESWYQERPQFTLPWPEAQQYTYICLQASGDSMHPTIYHHDWLIARWIDDPQLIQEGYVYIILTTDGPVVKRVLNRIQERATLALQSDNDQYPTYDQPIRNVLALYRVQYRLSANLRNENAGLLQRIQRLEDRYNRIEDRLSRD